MEKPERIVWTCLLLLGLAFSIPNVYTVQATNAKPEPHVILIPTAKRAFIVQKIPIGKSQKISLDAWIEKLVQKESGGRNISIIDSNGLPSRGCLMFQEKTWNYYSLRYLNEVPPIMDCQKQKIVAKAMILENYNNWRHWYNSTLAIGKP